MSVNLWRLPQFFSNIVRTPARYKLDYIVSMTLLKKNLRKPLPWVNYEAIEFIKSNMPSIQYIFEYGSGQSTLFWLENKKKVVSIEHNETFFNLISTKIKATNLVEYKFIAPEKQENQYENDFSNPDYYQSADMPYFIFKNYVRSIDFYDDDYFDLVMIDGRARPSCIAHATRKIKCGGILMLDNSDRSYYLKESLCYIANWTRFDFYGTVRGLINLQRTSFFIKPCNNVFKESQPAAN